jgi:ABC-type transport system substrate-binding protein
MFGKNIMICLFRLSWFFLLIILCTSGCSRSPEGDSKTTSVDWILRDSVSANVTRFDPIQIVDAATLNMLANCYEGLVIFDANGNIVPGVAERWEISNDKLEWTFYLKPGVRFHPCGEIQGFKHSGQLSAKDAVYSLSRAITAPTSFNSWWLGDIVARRDNGTPEIWATAPLTLKIRLRQPFALLNRLVSVAGWIYPENIIDALGEQGLVSNVVGTGPYRLSRFIPDDQVTLVRWNHYHGERTDKSPKTVVVHIISDHIAALESFRSGRLDAVELNLDTLNSGRALAKKQKMQLVSIIANHLDYFCMNLEKKPFDDPDLRMALNMCIDRKKLTRLFQGLAIPAYGFTPPTSPAYRGEDEVESIGFHYDPAQARNLFESFAKRSGLNKEPLELKLTYDNETMLELTAEFFKDSVEKILPLSISLEKITWPELIQRSFGGQLAFHRLWWLIATPSEDIYFQFFMPGKSPPVGLNISRYNNPDFSNQYNEVFGNASREKRLSGIMELESQLIHDAVAIPLWHRKAEFLIRKGIDLPIGSTLRRFYSKSRKIGGHD